MKVKIIQRDNENALIEWVDAGQYRRSIVPLEAIDGDQCEHPERGIEYGEDWVELIPALDPFALANELRRRGVWTLEDLRQHRREALSAVQKVASGLLINLAGRAQT